MNSVTDKLDEIMEQASQALADMDYLACEALCVQALTEAREQKRYRYYARVLLPLQEARRQRRMIAAQGEVLLGGTAGGTAGGAAEGIDWDAWLAEDKPGCLALTHPNTVEDAKALAERAREQGRFVEVLFADNQPDTAKWLLRAYEGPEVSCEVDAPTESQAPSQWFLNATEKLGDAALSTVDETLTGEARVEALEARLRVFPDHELLHQHLAQAARAVGT